MSAYFQENADSLLAALGKKLGLEGLEFYEDENGDNQCTLRIDKKRIIHIACNEPQILIHTELGFLPEEGRNTIIEQLLEANLLWAGTRGATFSIERASARVLLARAITLFNADGNPLSVEEFETAIVDLVDVANYWEQLLHPDKTSVVVDITELD